jgi:hypothetical protein
MSRADNIKKLLEKYHTQRDQAIEILGNKCKSCGSIDRLEIDHIDPATKELDISKQWNHPAFWDVEKRAFVKSNYAKCSICKK